VTVAKAVVVAGRHERKKRSAEGRKHREKKGGGVVAGSESLKGNFKSLRRYDQPRIWKGKRRTEDYAKGEIGTGEETVNVG